MVAVVGSVGATEAAAAVAVEGAARGSVKMAEAV
jgi:hypothetical protein